MHRFLARGQRVAAIAVTSALLLGASVAAHAQKVKLATSAGDIVIELDKAKAPKTVDNFVAYVKDGHYNGTVFHRVIPNFMVQGGDPEGTGRGGPGYRFEDEFLPALKHGKAGLLSIDNAGPNTNGSQFFITTATADFLNTNGHYTIFGQVVKGMEFVDKIKKGDSRNNGSVSNPDKIIKMQVASDVKDLPPQ